MKTIWKFALEVTDLQKIEMPQGAQLLTAQVQAFERGVKAVMLWAEVNPNAPKVQRLIGIHGTGHTLPEPGGMYLATFQLRGGLLVFHVYDRGEAP